jgi:hypothetical protein
VGYGVPGLAFASGHVFALRRWSASSIGPSYTAVWHRRANGRWRIYSDVCDRSSCSRYISDAVPECFETAIRLDWLSPWALRVTVPEAAIEWHLSFADTLATLAFGLGVTALPERALHSTAALELMTAMAPVALGVHGLRLTGVMPNGQHYRVAPRRVLRVRTARASWGGEDLGAVQLDAPPVHLGSLSLTMSGLFAFMTARFTDAAGREP